MLDRPNRREFHAAMLVMASIVVAQAAVFLGLRIEMKANVRLQERIRERQFAEAKEEIAEQSRADSEALRIGVEAALDRWFAAANTRMAHVSDRRERMLRLLGEAVGVDRARMDAILEPTLPRYPTEGTPPSP